MTGQTRGERNNNPGNIRKSRDPWQGLDDPPDDGAFFRFKEMYWGVRAMARILINYQDKSGIHTIRDAIAKWAPPNDGNNTESYIRTVSERSGIKHDDLIDFHHHEHIKPIIVAMIHVECGGLVLPDAVIDRGLALAGVEPPLAPSRTIRAAVATGAAVVVPYVPDALQAIGSQSDTLRSLASHWPAAGGLATFAVLCGVAYIIYRKLADRAALRP